MTYEKDISGETLKHITNTLNFVIQVFLPESQDRYHVQFTSPTAAFFGKCQQLKTWLICRGWFAITRNAHGVEIKDFRSDLFEDILVKNSHQPCEVFVEPHAWQADTYTTTQLVGRCFKLQ